MSSDLNPEVIEAVLTQLGSQGGLPAGGDIGAETWKMTGEPRPALPSF